METGFTGLEKVLEDWVRNAGSKWTLTCVKGEWAATGIVAGNTVALWIEDGTLHIQAYTRCRNRLVCYNNSGEPTHNEIFRHIGIIAIRCND
jgi:hypothetical protein